MPCTAETARALTYTEYDFLHCAANLNDLAEVLARCAVDVPRCAVASRQVKKLSRMLQHVLTCLDPDITDAIAAVEHHEPPPF